MSDFQTASELLDFHPTAESFHDAVVGGLSSQPKTLPCKYFYDRRGSQLFDQICELDEYYVTRSELQIMRRHAAEMASQIGRDVMLVEYGSGSSVKTRLLLDELPSPAAYVPVDISKQHLQATADDLASVYPEIEVLPVCADFTCGFRLPTSVRPPSHVAVYFPGSTIGNFTPDAAIQILDQISRQVGVGGGLLIGIDLQKPISILEAAYDDARGVTAEFNLNLLSRIDDELDADVDVDQFSHRAKYNSIFHRIEMQLVSETQQAIRVGDKRIELDKGEAITTEFSHKYTVEGFSDMAAKVGFQLHKSWTDADDRFAVLHLVVEEG